MEVPRGKDTTVMFEAGAHAVAGIDQKKTLITLRSTSPTGALDILAMQGITIVVLEGYKESALPKIILGDLEADGCILRNPAPEDVFRNLDRFPDYITLGELLRELKESCKEKGQACTMATATIPLPADSTEDSLSSIEQELPALVRSMEALSGVTGARASIRHGTLFGGTDELLVAVAAESGDEAFSALQLGLTGCIENLEVISPR
jgi:molybdopterin synthase catalytic subunit